MRRIPLPRFLARRAGYYQAFQDRTELTTALATAHTAAWAAQPADVRKAVTRLPNPRSFQPGLVDLHRDHAVTTAYLFALANAAETNLDLADPEQRALYQDLLDAAHRSQALEAALVTAAKSTLCRVDESLQWL